MVRGLAQDSINRVVFLPSGGIPMTLQVKLHDHLCITQTVEAVVQRPLIRAAGGRGKGDRVFSNDHINATAGEYKLILKHCSNIRIELTKLFFYFVSLIEIT